MTKPPPAVPAAAPDTDDALDAALAATFPASDPIALSSHARRSRQAPAEAIRRPSGSRRT